ncbi:MAG: hypothetical protein WCR54_02970 [Clostridia bacterium]
MQLHHFGTDGIRAKNEVFTTEYLKRIAYGITNLKQEMTVVIGRDPRVSGKYIEKELIKTLIATGASVISVGMVPTPTLAFLTKFYGADYGVMLSASHNPPEFNGIKLFTGAGEKVSEETELAVEKIIDNKEFLPRKGEGTFTTKNGDQNYIDYIIDKIKPNLSGVKVLLDTANGATAIIAPKLFEIAGAKVTQLKNEVDGININNGCGATQIDFLAKEMAKGDFDIGFAYDGDGDRVKCVANNKIFDGDHLMYCHCKDWIAQDKLPNNAMVGTIMSNLGTENACKKNGIKLIRVGVGDKFVYREMVACGYKIGGEESGHMIFMDYLRTGDGMIASLLSAILNLKTPLIALDDIEMCPAITECVMCDKQGVANFNGSKIIASYLANIEKEYRIVVRPSGTEPKIRILVENENSELATLKALEIKKVIKENI